MAKPKTYVAFVLDESGSMLRIRQQTVAALNRFIEDVKAATVGQDVRVSFYTYADNVRRRYFNADVTTLQPFELTDFKPDGCTALADGQCTCIDDHLALADSKDENVSFLIRHITDGGENQSDEGNKRRLGELMKTVQKTGRWTMAFMVPPGASQSFFTEYHVPNDNVREWENTAAGVAKVVAAEKVATESFFASRAMGAKAVDSYYATTDLSKVTSKDISAKLDDISDRFRVLEVAKEMRIDEFVTSKTKKPYIVGSGYYQLMKKETIQPNKEVLIVEKGKKAVWGGSQARELIGLPADTKAVVTPGNHANWDIFVQSKVPNRKLPRGTKLLLDTTKKVADKGTWDYEAAYAAAEAKKQAAAAASS